MRVAVIYFAGPRRKQLVELSRSLAKGLESQGHDVDLVDGDRDVNTKLTIYNYLAFGTASTSVLGGGIPASVDRFLKNAGMISGKRCFAFVAKRGIRNGKTLQKLMQVMEHEGMYLKFSEVFVQPDEAEAVGKKLHIG